MKKPRKIKKQRKSFSLIKKIKCPDFIPILFKMGSYKSPLISLINERNKKKII